MVSVLAPYQGASPDVVEKQVVEPLEDSLEAVDGIEGVTSTASEGNAIVMAPFDYGSGTKQLVADVQQAVNRARAQLPDDVDPQVVAGSTDDMPTVVLAVTSDKDQQALADQLDRTVVPDLKAIDGVGQVTVDGVRDLQVTVTPDDTNLTKAGLTSAALAQALQAGGTTVPAGSFDEDGANRTVQVGGGFTSVEQIQDLMVTGQTGKKPVRLGDVATVKQESAAADSLTRTDGRPSLAVMVTTDQDGSAVSISDAVEDKLAGMREDLGSDATVTVGSSGFMAAFGGGTDTNQALYQVMRAEGGGAGPAGTRGRVTAATAGLWTTTVRSPAVGVPAFCILWLELLYGEGDPGRATAQGRPEIGRRIQAGRPARLRRHGGRLLGQIALGP
ncbi:multidrug efflux pump subunit AcrB [Streptomyces canus]|nr:multidrug efflux pump subunit AcrB [Streptomyces canus]